MNTKWRTQKEKTKTKADQESEFLEPPFLERAREGVGCWAARTEATRFDLRSGLLSVVPVIVGVGEIELVGNDGDAGKVMATQATSHQPPKAKRRKA